VAERAVEDIDAMLHRVLADAMAAAAAEADAPGRGGGYDDEPAGLPASFDLQTAGGPGVLYDVSLRATKPRPGAGAAQAAYAASEEVAELTRQRRALALAQPAYYSAAGAAPLLAAAAAGAARQQDDADDDASSSDTGYTSDTESDGT
jgi:hypothetical protein